MCIKGEKDAADKRVRAKELKDWFDEYKDETYAKDKDSDIIYHVVTSGVYVQDYFSRLLNIKRPGSGILCQFNILQEKETADIFNKCIVFKQDKTISYGESEETLLKALVKTNKEGMNAETTRVIVEYPESLTYYEELCVDEVPYSMEIGDKKYIISPISVKWSNYDSLIGRYQGNLQEFVNDITNSEEFKFLVLWVSNHTVNLEYRNDEEKICAKYIELIKKIYYFEKRSENNRKL